MSAIKHSLMVDIVLKVYRSNSLGGGNLNAAVDDALIADSGAGLVAFLGVVLHELLAQLLDGGRFAGFRLGCAGITTPAYLGQPFLRE